MGVKRRARWGEGEGWEVGKPPADNALSVTDSRSLGVEKPGAGVKEGEAGYENIYEIYSMCLALIRKASPTSI